MGRELSVVLSRDLRILIMGDNRNRPSPHPTVPKEENMKIDSTSTSVRQVVLPIAIQAVIACALVLTASASDQTIIISQQPKVCSAGIAAPLDIISAPAAINAALGVAPDPSTYYIIHDVTYNSDFSVSEQHWYVYYADWQNPSTWAQIEDPRIAKHFEESRIYGSSRVGLVYFHRNVLGTTAEVAVTRATARAAGAGFPAEMAGYLVNNKIILGNARAPSQTEIDAATGPAKQTLTDQGTALQFDLVDDSTARKLVGFSPHYSAQSYVIDEAFNPLATSLSYTIDITKKIPAPVQDLQGIIRLAQGQAGKPKTLSIGTDQLTLCGGQTFVVSALPSDMTTTANVSTGNGVSGSSSKQIGKNTFDNERKYHYDFSLALPLKSYQDLTVNSSDLTITAKKVDKQNLFAMVNLSPFPYDTKKASFQVLPVFLYGMPITGKPLNHHLIAAAVGLNRVQFFAGILVSHNKDAPGNSVPGSSSSSSTSTGPVRDYWSAKVSYGINFPVSTITSLLKK